VIDNISAFIITAGKEDVTMRSELGQEGFQCEYDNVSYGFTGTANMNNSASIRTLRKVLKTVKLTALVHCLRDNYL
jgi:hypothetical protein